MSDYAQAYKSATDEFIALIETLTQSDLDKSDSEGWSPRQVIHHLADSEAQAYARLRRLIAEPGTVIQGYDEGIWAQSQTLGYKTQDTTSSIAVIKAVRQASFELIKRLSESELDNEGTHSESGPYTVRNWLASYTRHPVDHAQQIKNQL